MLSYWSCFMLKCRILIHGLSFKCVAIYFVFFPSSCTMCLHAQKHQMKLFSGRCCWWWWSLPPRNRDFSWVVAVELSSGQIRLQEHMKRLFFNPWPRYYVPIWCAFCLYKTSFRLLPLIHSQFTNDLAIHHIGVFVRTQQLCFFFFNS